MYEIVTSSPGWILRFATTTRCPWSIVAVAFGSQSWLNQLRFSLKAHPTLVPRWKMLLAFVRSWRDDKVSAAGDRGSGGEGWQIPEE
jgi:hypothetical protein